MKITFYYFLALLFLGYSSTGCTKTVVDPVETEEGVRSQSARSDNIKLNLRPGNPNLMYEETLEDRRPFSELNQNSLGNWEYAVRYVDKPVFQGNQAVRFEIREWQKLVQGGKRAEVVIVKGADKDITKNAWYSFSVYFPSSGYEYDNEREVINQWFQDGTPATSLRTQRDRFILETGAKPSKRVQYDLGAIEKDRWHEFVFHFIHSHDDDGRIEVWHDGVKILKRKGGNMYDDILPKWKIGLYKASFKYGTSRVNRRVIYFDNIRVGNKNASFEDMTSLYKTTPDTDPGVDPVTEPAEPDPDPDI
ncbi:polysaccharide lyase [Paraflavisolibacter sp. H34]|uniref:polysaccharide lyase n=1 Tax=Huijunlia imazamoxiresistens TaxID=3127457 RepID=UPI0030169AB3